MSLQIWHDARMEEHHPGDGHPERPARLRAVHDALRQHPDATWPAVEPATVEQLCRVHDEGFVRRLLATAGTPAVLDEDTATSAGSIQAALLAAGAVAGACRAVWEGPDRRAFALVRPPGHHAEKHHAMGFCLFNNVAVAVADRLADGAERILVVDWDVHHGNGTQHLFEDEPRVGFFSTHQGYGFYPGTGSRSERGRDNVRNVPLRPGDGHAELVAAFEGELVPFADQLRPELVVVSAGFDAHRDDPLGQLRATDDTFAILCRVVKGIADRHAEGRLVLALEGGYDLGALGRCASRCAAVLSERG